MFRPKSEYLWKQLQFRDKLRTDADLAKKYQEIKEKLSKTYSKDKLSYVDAKTEFINSVISATLPAFSDGVRGPCARWNATLSSRTNLILKDETNSIEKTAGKMDTPK